MANTFLLKRSNTASNVPTAGELSEGELAINTNPADRALYSKDSGGTVFQIGAGTIGGTISDNQVAVGAAVGNTIEGSANLTWDGSQFLLPLENDAVTPTLAFGDGDSGLYELSDDTIRMAIAGLAEYQWSASYFTGTGSNSFHCSNDTASRTLATIGPHRNNSGFGGINNTELSIILTGGEMIRFIDNGTYDAILSQYGIFIAERAAADVDIAAYGQIWVENDAPNRVKFTDDAGADWPLQSVHEAEYAYSSTVTAGDPGAYTLRFDSVTIGSITNMYIDDLSRSEDWDWVLSNLADGDLISIKSALDPADYIIATVNGTPTDGTGYWTVPLTLVHTGTIFTNGDPLRVSVQWFSQAGGGSQTPWTSDIDGAGFGLDNIDRLEIQASGVATDTATFTHDGTDFNTAFANTTDWNLTGLTANLRLEGAGLSVIGDGKVVGAANTAITASINMFNDGTDGNIKTFGTAADVRFGNYGTATGYVSIEDGYSFRVFDSTTTDYADFKHDGTDFNTTFVTTTDWNISGITAVNVTGTLAATTVTGANVTSGADPGHTHGAGSVPNHDSLNGFVANEHIDWTSATSNFSTTGTVIQGTDSASTVHLQMDANSGGFVIEPGTTIGGWARGHSVKKQSDATVMAGAGFLGSNESVTSWHVGFGASWWATDDVFRITPTLVESIINHDFLAGIDVTGASTMQAVTFSGTTTHNGGATFNTGDNITFASDCVLDWPAMEIYATANDGIIRVIGGTGTDLFLNTNTTENSLICRGNSGVELYYDNVLKFQTVNQATSDTGTGAQVVDGLGTMQPVGMNVMPVYEIDVDDAFDLAHTGMMWHRDAGTAVNYTCNSDSAIPVGATYVVFNEGTDSIEITQGTATVYWLEAGSAPASGSVTVDQGGIVTVYKYADAEFWVWGAKTSGGGLNNIVEDTTPQLGGELDVNGFDINGSTGVTLQYNGQDNIVGTSAGMNVWGSSTASFVNIMNNVGTSQGSIGWASAGNFKITSLQHGLPFVLAAEDAGGTERTILTADPDSTTELRADTNLELSVTAGADTALLATSNGAVDLYYNNVAAIGTQLGTSTGNTSYARVKDHLGTYYDVGFNTLGTQNFNASLDLGTTGAQACGKAWGKTTTTAYTLTGPSSSEVDFPVGGVLQVLNLGTSGNLTFNDDATCTMYHVTGSAVTDIVGTGTLAPGGMVTLWRYSASAIYIWGSGFTA